MVSDRQLIWAGFLGACAMAVLELASSDWRARAAGGEEEACKDKSPEFRAMMVRAPGEAHSGEWCAQIMRFGSKDWVPAFQHPLLKPKNESR